MDSEEARQFKVLMKGIRAYQKMLTAYRTGNPKLPEYVFKDIEKVKLIISQYEEHSKTKQNPEDLRMSELSDFQKEVGEWGDKTFNSQRDNEINACIVGICNHLQKEVLELKEACVGFVRGYPKKSISPWKEISEETVDCFILLIQLAHTREFDLLDEARKKMGINRNRRWGKPGKDGVIEHLK